MKLGITIAMATAMAGAQTLPLTDALWLQYKVDFKSYNQWFPLESKFPGQEKYASYFSLSPDLTLQSDWQIDLRLKPILWYEPQDHRIEKQFFRLEGENRTRLYFEELYLDHYSDAYEIRAGFQTWSFKTVESVSQTDVLNAADNGIDFSDAPKYGELALRLRAILPTDQEQVLELLWLPIHQTSLAPRSNSRFNFFAESPLPFDEKAVEYNQEQKEFYPTFALRYGSTLFESFDFNLLGIYGYDKSPHYVVQLDEQGDAQKLVPRYETSWQIGSNLQGAIGPWLLKTEIMFHQFEEDSIVHTERQNRAIASTKARPSIGITTGLEYTFYSPLIEGHDLGVIAEGIYNTNTHLAKEEQILFQPFKNHLFTGLRYVFNTPSDRTLLLGTFISLKDPETLWRIEYEERYWQIFKLKLRGILFYGSSDSDFKNFNKNQRLDAILSYTF